MFLINSLVFAATPNSLNEIKYTIQNEVLIYLKDKILKPSFFSTDEQSSEQALKGKKIVIDPGHGGTNPGAVKYGMRESDNNLAVSLKVKELLENYGAEVIMTRETDQSVAKEGLALKEELQARIDIANAQNADVFVSLHTNSNPNTDIAGAMTFYSNDTSKKLADNIQKSLIGHTNAADKGIEKENFYVLRNNEIPAVLVEMGFITNKKEAIKLNSDAYRDDLASGIANGLIDYFN